MLPNPQDLLYFIEVAATSNVSRAAERLGITQPTLSLSLQRLEALVGQRLLIRSKRGVELTPAGKLFSNQAQKIHQDWTMLQSSLQRASSEVKGHIRLGAHASVAHFSWAKILPKVLVDNPELEISLVHDLSRKITEGILSLKIDMGVVVNPHRHPDLILRKLCEDEVTLWQSKKIKPENEKILICEPDLLQSQDILRKLKRKKVEFSRTITSPNLDVVASMVAEGVGVGVLPGRVASLAHSALAPVKSAPTFKDEIYLAYHMEFRQLKTFQELARACEAFFKSP